MFLGYNKLYLVIIFIYLQILSLKTYDYNKYSKNIAVNLIPLQTLTKMYKYNSQNEDIIRNNLLTKEFNKYQYLLNYELSHDKLKKNKNIKNNYKKCSNYSNNVFKKFNKLFSSTTKNIFKFCKKLFSFSPQILHSSKDNNTSDLLIYNLLFFIFFGIPFILILTIIII
ncbi:hypothetical protein PFUGPA_02660 [Plasmodium falciparum Palo Alto/Uganda]|uniref:Uncharacterized protein n=10 Tax=Plasmodium falciparum TaxID=5833 RepID=C0H5M5_PLAF7|nr:probable protein, unknown function [Plasmodium falciparum 3D7]ETW32911.1 hypothetical protein PFTANZ_06369 [Plasmodium falciparum Tanzania (2000708)]ETW40477.1 hypothetical protein PFNF135_05173 [Plasmodium falciparum NF135/5.C10]ETW55345.1 hypothetical protein PFUGPA_02660 [Plasmodium falciparum Palo Alto/Uganda]ETW59156.1 hypothetical protein PFMC_04948 [Plasmodium falciparum CAMP/Malaysia]EUR55613.1 hypothetical protein PFBG_06030 [Plasmodium falciparum 7G8]EWC86385.1 hypothetical prote|eukprot:XP_002809122.1 probable protein, unknown function [Plasmodium falciparum 3D7]